MFYVKNLWDVLLELDTLLLEVDTNRVAREIAIIKRSIENLDKMLWLFDLTDEDNLKNADELAWVLSDHINYRYNVKQPWSPMVDYELTLAQSWFRYLIKKLEENWDIHKMPEQFLKNKEETIRMTAEARAAHKEQVEKAKAEHEAKVAEMEAKQKELDSNKEQDEQLQDSVDNGTEWPTMNINDYETQ